MTHMDERNDPVRHFTCMQAAAAAGIAPRVLYASAEDGIAITDFVAEAPFPPALALVELPGTLRKLHGLPPFPKPFDHAMAHRAFIWRFRAANLPPSDAVEAIFTRYRQLCAIYPRLDSDMVSCHCDLKPENLLFDGHRVWLVDWQAAFVNDRYFDLALVANFLVHDDAAECLCLERYFGAPPDEYQRARFFLMRQMVHLFYAAVFLLLGSPGKPLTRSADLPSFQEFHAAIWAGAVNLADNQAESSTVCSIGPSSCGTCRQRGSTTHSASSPTAIAPITCRSSYQALHNRLLKKGNNYSPMNAD
jgi:hypothetical protein